MVDMNTEQLNNIMAGSSPAYPEHPGEPDCVYYLRHGMCGYGSRCRFNHPPASARPLQFADQAGSEGQLPERVGQPDCQYYLRTGDCKYGANCKYNHPCKIPGSSKEEVQLNLSGLPMRLGERECAHYARTGACKFGLNCKFHHPQPGATAAPVVSMSTSRPVYTLGTYHPSLDPVPLHAKPYIMARGSYLPGLRIPAASSYTPVILSPQWGFKGEPQCSFYLRYGICKFGPVCKFDHPILVPCYNVNAFGARPIVNMAMGVRIGMSGSATSYLHAEGLNGSQHATDQSKLKDEERPAAVCVAGTINSKVDGEESATG